MRIVGGRLKGKRFNAPSNIKARPTTDMAREGLFNMLNTRIDYSDLDVLDLFTGTGAISLEFISRDVKSVTAIDIEYITKKHLEKIIKSWDISNLRVVRADVLALSKKANQAFDLVFADPPYQHKRFKEIPGLILNSGWVKPDGIFILEHSADFEFADHPLFSFHRKFGNVNFTFFEAQ